MSKTYSLGNRLIALMLSIIMILGMLPANAIALESTAVAQIGDVTYDTLADAIAAVTTGTNQVAPPEATTVKLLRDTAYAFDVGISTGATTMNLKLDLNGKTLTLAPSVGSVGTKANGIRVLAYSKLEIVNGTILCSSETADNVKVGIANYGTLTLDNVSLKAGSLTQYTVNNRGALTLKGNTAISSGSICAVTNDPYNLYYTSAVNASVTCESSDVAVESMLVERYERDSENNGIVELNISAGYFGKIVEDGNNAVGASYDVTGGIIGVSTTEELDFALNMINAGAEYAAPEKAVTIKLMTSIAGSFDVGISNGKAPKNICLDLNGNTLTLKPGVGSFNTETNGIRVLAYSKLEVKNGTLLCSSEAADKVKVGIANYGELILDGVALKAGDQTIYTVNNRGALALKGNTSITAGSTTAITNDPYNLYYTSDVDASVTCDSSDVSVESILVERYERNSENKGGIKLNISAGYFGKIEEDGASAVGATYTITGGSFGSDISDFCSDEYKVVKDENDNYVVKSKQANFGFEKDEYKVTFGANGNKFTAVAQNANGEVTYSFVTETDVAEINAQTGELTILKAGTIQVKAVAAGNAQYIEAEDTYTLVIEPAYAEVHSFSGGTVTGSGAADTVVSIDNAILEWVAKDESIGRTQDGWWVGIKIVAPDGVDLSKAVYQRRSDGTYDGAEVTPFVPESDRYLGMWCLVTEEYLESFSEAGKKMNYVWRFSWDGDDVYEQTIAITIDPAGITLKQSGFAFGIDEETITFGEDYTARVPSGGQASKVTYSVDDTEVAEINAETGKLIVKKAGTVKITATLSGDFYESISDSYVLTINKADQTGFAFENAPSELTWQKEAMDVLSLINGKGEGAVTWTITEGNDVATVSADGKITLLKAGSFTIQAQKAEDDCYNASAVITATITINKATQSGFGFGETENVAVTYNDNGNKYTLAATGGQSTKDVVYSVISGDAATVDAANGVVTITKAGTVVIQAAKPADDQYNEATDTYELVIEKDEQQYTLTETGTVALKYGTTTYTNTANAGALVSKENKPVYTHSQNTIGATVNSTTGEVTFADSEGKIGQVTITVTVAEDDCYKEFTASYVIDVSYLTTDAVPTTDGETKNTSGWYTDKVVIKAPAGYSIAYDNKLSTEWKSEIPYAEEGNNNATVFLKDANGYITDKITVADIKLDTGDPDESGISITYDEPMWQKVLEDITFGIYKADTLLVKLSATDATSGIASLTYNIGGEDVVITFNGESSVSHSFSINAQHRNKVTLKATDVAGREITKNSDHTVVLDTKVPELDTKYEYASGQHREENDIFYTQGDVKVYFTIKETNFDLSNKPVVTVDGVEKVVTWTQVENTDEWKSDLTLTGNGDYVVKVTFTDIATNEMVTYEQEIRIDENAPELVVDFDNDSAKNGNNYKADRNATITITEHNFKAEEVVVSVTAKNILNQNVDVMDYAAYAKNPANWASEGNVHTLVLPFTVDAIYSFTVDYTDLSGRAATGYAEDFVIDHTPATDIEISYNTSIIEKAKQFFSFGIYQAKAEVTITAKDMTSGVDYFILTYTKAADASSINKETFTTEPLAAVQSNTDASIFTATYTLEHEADGTFSVVLFDKADNKSEDLDEKRIVVDMKNPLMGETDVVYEFASGEHNEENGIYYTQGDVTINFYIDEANFHLADAPVITVNDEACDVEWSATSTEDVWTGKIKLTGDGDYKVKATFVDASTNPMDTYQKTVHIDSAKPVIEITYDNNAYLNDNCYKGDRTATIKVTEHNFKPQNVDLKVDAKDIMGDYVAVMDYLAYAKNPANWDSDGDVHILEIPFTTDAIYNVTVDCKDLAGNTETNVQPEFVIDQTPVENIQISYSSPVLQTIIEKLTFGFYQAEVVVTVTAEDLTSGVDYFELTYTRDPKATDAHAATETWTLQAQPGANAKSFTASKTVPAQARGSFSVVVYDKAGNPEDANDNNSMIVTDTVNSNIQIEYTELDYDDGFRDANDDVVTPNDAVKFYYNKDVTAKITIEEASFFEGKKAGANDEGIVHQVVLKVTKTDDNGVVTVKEYLCAGAEQKVTGAQKEIIEWTTTGDVHTTSITFADDGDYVLEMSYQDFSGNDAPINGSDGNSGNITYTSRIITVDKTAPDITISYNPVTPLNENCYKDNRIATITVVEHNFKAEEFVVEVDTDDLLGDITVSDFAAYAKNPDNWNHNGNTHTLDITFSADAIYTFSGSYADMAGNSDSFDEPDFVVDHTPADNIKITYSTPVFSKIIEALTFGFYRADVVVTVTAEDVTSGVDYFELTYTRDEDATDAHTDNFMQKLEAKAGADAKTFTASYTVPAQARGSYSVKVYDRAGNDSDSDDHKSVIVTDTVSPEIKIDFAAKDPNTKVHFVDADYKNVETFAESTNAFFGGDVVATITVDEANFFEGKKAGVNNDEIVHEIIIKVTKTDDNENKTVTEYLCDGAEQLVTGAKKEIIEWTTNGDTHTASITFANDGDYVLEITYSDFSENDSKLTGNDGVSANKTYTSKVITVDKTAPVIEVTYGNTEVINTIEGRKYFNKTQSAVIKVTEHNFRAEDIAAVITAKNVVDADVNVADFAAQLANKANWKQEGNVYTAEVQYTVDANYTFDIDFVDLALNASADYTKDLFTVDTTAPENLTVSYSTSVLDKILESITFGYYNAEMTVTITAEDDTAGIYYFVYSYIKSEGVSDVNTELINDKIEDANNRIVYEGKKSTTSFTIPKLLLANDNQFNGTVKFTAFDRSENNTEKVDNQRIIVDNIAPTAKITYNQPVQNANNISYYAGNIDAKIVINEANFYSEDVVVTVTKDGASYPVNVKWVDDSVDVHTGTFTLTADGDYIVTVEYKDRSNNQMNKYTSSRLTLDTKAPSVSVSNIKNNSANKDEKYGFTITATDINLDASSFKPVLSATVRKDDGSYETKTVSLGDMKTVEAGKTYTFTVDNLEEDAVYSLVCTLKDMSGNQYSKILLSDNESYDEVRFSINRNGSTFAVDKDTDELVNQYYVYSVNEDVVIEEVNVDPVETYVVKLNGEKLTEGTDYTTSLSNKDGEWSKRTYVISKELFESEGEYSIVVESTDKAETTAYSDVKNLNVSFVVDQTAPVLTISGLENGGRYQVEEQTVTIIPTDDGGRLYSIKVVVLNSDGEPIKDASGMDISVRLEMSGEEFLNYLTENGGKVTFTVPEGLENQVQIICNDYAVNASGETNEFNETFTKVTVSQSQWIIFYANKPLFYGTIAGIVLLAGGIIALIFFNKKKKVAKK